jgi:hypothetical protein
MDLLTWDLLLTMNQENEICKRSYVIGLDQNRSRHGNSENIVLEVPSRRSPMIGGQSAVDSIRMLMQRVPAEPNERSGSALYSHLREAKLLGNANNLSVA